MRSEERKSSLSSQPCLDHYPFGWEIKERSFSTDTYRFGFNGMEKNEEINSGNYDFGARINDTRLGRWSSVDPVEHPWQSPYTSIDNNPIARIDPDGQTGIGTINKRKKTVTIKSRLIFYGKGRGNRRANKDFAKQIAAQIQQDYNNSNGKIDINGEEYSLKFKITGRYSSLGERAMRTRVSLNLDMKNNFVRLTPKGLSKSSYFSNSASWSVEQLESTNLKTASHEYAHMSGWRILHNERMQDWSWLSHDIGTLSEDGKTLIPSIMVAQEFPKNYPTGYGLPPYSNEYLNKSGNVDMSKRVVTDRDISKLANSWTSKALKIKRRRIIFGQMENDYRNKQGKAIGGAIFKKNKLNPLEGER